MNQKNDKLPMKSPDLTADYIEQIGTLFPQVLIEITGEDGTIRHGINFDLLRQELAGGVVEGREERYEYTWVGKRRSIVEANRPVNKTLRPCVEESKDWENTKNIFIEGDNLDALKLLQESYLNAVKMIYIDPPYNTGNDFIYNDTFVMDSDEYDEETGVVDEAGNRMFKNSKDRGRYHSDWCSMLYPRLKLAKNLLRDDGVIFVSIDDNEVHNIRKMMDEVFGEENFIAIIPRVTKKAGKTTNTFAKNTDYLICYFKSENGTLYSYAYDDEEYKYTDEFIEERGKFKLNQTLDYSSIQYSPSLDYEIEIEGIILRPGNATKEEMEERKKRNPKSDFCWRWSRELFNFGEKNGFIVLKKSKDGYRIYTKTYQKVSICKFGKEYSITLQERTKSPTTLDFIENRYSNDNSKKDLARVFDENYFDYSKPINLIKDIGFLSTNCDDIILDFFAGSCTTAHSVIHLNSDDGNKRKFIMIQLPELCSENTEAFKAGFKTIADIGKERIRRAGEQIKTQIEQENSQSTLTGSPKPIPDIGFRVFKVDDTNMKDVYYSATEYTQETIEGLIDNVKEDRTDLDLLYQVLLSWGLKLDLTHTTEKIDTFTIHHIDPENNSLIACFDSNIPEEVMRKIAQMKPLRAVFRDGSFKDSPGKLNIDGIFKTLSPNTTVRVI